MEILEQQIETNPFAKYQIVDDKGNAVAVSPDGDVILKIADYMGRSQTRKIGHLYLLEDDKLVYEKHITKKHILDRAFTRAVGINLNFIDLLPDDAIILIKLGKKDFAITKLNLLIHGVRPKSGISGWERQLFCELEYFQEEKN